MSMDSDFFILYPPYTWWMKWQSWNCSFLQRLYFSVLFWILTRIKKQFSFSLTLSTNFHCSLFFFRGRIPHEDIYQLMCDMQPPVGFGKKCPRFLAYKVNLVTRLLTENTFTLSYHCTMLYILMTAYWLLLFFKTVLVYKSIIFLYWWDLFR